MRNSRLLIFLSIHLICYGTFLFLDLKGYSIDLSTGIKFGVILLCLAYTILTREGNGSRDLALIRFALFFTLVSDFIILFLPEGAYLFGVLTFIIVQQLYGIRLKGIDNRSRDLPEGRDAYTSLLLRLGIQLLLAVIILLLLSLVEIGLDSLLIASVFYFVSLVHNTVNSVRIAIRRPYTRSNTLFASGLVLFLLCDINVGLFNLTAFIPHGGEWVMVAYRLAAILMWTFYAPSQVLIALSAVEYPLKRTKKQKKFM